MSALLSQFLALLLMEIWAERNQCEVLLDLLLGRQEMLFPSSQESQTKKSWSYFWPV